MGVRKNRQFHKTIDVVESFRKAEVVNLPHKGQPLTHHEILHNAKSKLWCGPAAVAAVTGASTTDIHKLIKKYRKNPHTKITGTMLYEVEYAFEKLGYDMNMAYLYGEDSRPTLSQWLKKTKRERVRDVAYLVGLAGPEGGPGGHWVIIMNARYICSVSEDWKPLGKAMFRGRKIDGIFAITKT